MNTSWRGTRNQYITFAVPANETVSSMGIAWEESRGVEFEIQLSAGGGLFVPVWRGTSRVNNGTMEYYSFDGAAASDLRLVILSEEAAVKEIELAGY